MSYNIAYHVMLRAQESSEEIDLKDKRLTDYISKILKDNDCHEYCLGARYGQVNMLISLNPKIALDDLLETITSQTEKLLKQEIHIKGFTGWNMDHIVFTHGVHFMDHIIDFIKADDEEYQEERRAREMEFYQRAKEGWGLDDDPNFMDLIMLDVE